MMNPNLLNSRLDQSMDATSPTSQGLIQTSFARRFHGDSLETIYLTHHKAVRSLLYRLGIRQELDDMVQDVFLRVCHSWRQFRGDAIPRTWILKIAVNLVKDSRKKRRLDIDDSAGEVIDPVTAADPVLASEISRAIGRLKEESRLVFVLCVIEEYTMLEAAEILSIPAGTVKSRLFYAKSEIRAQLERGRERN